MPLTDSRKEQVALDVSHIKGVTQDSRAVKEGFLFAALKGKNHHGMDFIADAIKNGATHILMDKNAKLPKDMDVTGVTLFKVPNARQTFSYIVSDFYREQPDVIVAVTGTNGKTSVVNIVDQLWHALGYYAASLGTLGTRIGLQRESTASMTTPDPVTLHEALKELQEGGVTHLAMEASSHGLDQYRLDGVHIDAAALTNITHDHLDYHGSLEAYKLAKLRLITKVLDYESPVVLNADLEEYQAIKNMALGAGHSVISYGKSGEEIKLLEVKSLPHGQDLKLRIEGEEYETRIPLVGEFQAMNVICALGLVLATEQTESLERKEKIKVLIKAIQHLRPVEGRLQRVNIPRNVFVDYAHTPDALEASLKALRPHTKGRLYCVFGCGGDRDKDKRPVMGEIAARLADKVIVTDDNPRSEKPEDIRKQIIAGAKKAENIEEVAARNEAILSALKQMTENDLLLVAGKGHEQGQEINGEVLPFNDLEEIKKAAKTI